MAGINLGSNLHIQQVDIVTGMKETENMAEELMNIEIPQYKPSKSHVKLVNKGDSLLLFP